MHKLAITFLFAAVLAHFLVLREYTWRMWNLAHYQFFPIAIGCAIWLWWSRRDGKQNSRKPDSKVQTVALTINLLMVLFATLINSSFLGWLSFLLFLSTTAYSVSGYSSLRGFLPALFALSLITPLPGQLDQELILSMQSWASLFASWILDSVGLLHFRQGVVLVSETESFLAEEACSGIRSLFSGIFAVMFWGLLQRHSWWRHLINLVQVVGWVLSVNALRIASVIWIEDKTSFSVAKGIAHELLGLLAFFLIFGLAISFDYFVKFLFPVASDEEAMEETTSSSEPVPAAEQGAQSLSIPFPMAWIVCFGIVGLMAVRLTFVSGNLSVVPTSLAQLEAPEQTDLPIELVGWQIDDFKSITRTREDIQGQKSYVWELRSGLESAKLSLDCQWNDFHDLTYCYSGLGWKVETEHNYESMLQPGDDSGSLNYSRLRLTRPTGEQGWVLFCGLDKNGKEVQPPVKLGQNTSIHLWEKATNSLRLAFGFAEKDSIRAMTFEAPVTTVQILHVPSGMAGGSDSQRLESLFLAAREKVKQSTRFMRQ